MTRLTEQNASRDEGMRDCCAVQMGCCCGTRASRLCCRVCPVVNESTSTRLMYILFLLFGTAVMCSMLEDEMQGHLQAKFKDFNATCIDLMIEENCRLFTGYTAVYKVAFGFALFFLVMSLATVRVKSSRGCRATVHNGFWFAKFLLLSFLVLTAFVIPGSHLSQFHSGWVYVAVVGACVFVLVQMVLLLDLTRSVTERVALRVERGGFACCWYSLEVVLATVIFCIWAFGTILLVLNFAWSDSCITNKILIGVNASLCFLCALVSVLPCVENTTGDPRAGLLQSSVISTYIMYLTWMAISSEPRATTSPNVPKLRPDEFYTFNQFVSYDRFDTYDPYDRLNFAHPDENFDCGPSEDVAGLNEMLVPYVGILLMFSTLLYGCVGTSESGPGGSDPAVRNGGGAGDKPIPPEEDPGLCICCRPAHLGARAVEDEGGQMVRRNEREATTYSYPAFHLTLCLATMFVMMQLTNWYQPREAKIVSFDRSWSTVYIKMSASWACVLFYLASLVVKRLWPRAAGRTPAAAPATMQSHWQTRPQPHWQSQDHSQWQAPTQMHTEVSHHSPSRLLDERRPLETHM